MNETVRPRSMTPFIVVLAFVILMSAILIAYRNLTHGNSSFAQPSTDQISEADVRLAHGDPEGAMRILLSPALRDSATRRIAVARCLILSGRKREAIRILREARAFAPWDPLPAMLIQALEEEENDEDEDNVPSAEDAP